MDPLYTSRGDVIIAPEVASQGVQRCADLAGTVATIAASWHNDLSVPPHADLPLPTSARGGSEGQVMVVGKGQALDGGSNNANDDERKLAASAKDPAASLMASTRQTAPTEQAAPTAAPMDSLPADESTNPELPAASLRWEPPSPDGPAAGGMVEAGPSVAWTLSAADQDADVRQRCPDEVERMVVDARAEAREGEMTTRMASLIAVASETEADGHGTGEEPQDEAGDGKALEDGPQRSLAVMAATVEPETETGRLTATAEMDAMEPPGAPAALARAAIMAVETTSDIGHGERSATRAQSGYAVIPLSEAVVEPEATAGVIGSEGGGEVVASSTCVRRVALDEDPAADDEVLADHEVMAGTEAGDLPMPLRAPISPRPLHMTEALRFESLVDEVETGRHELATAAVLAPSHAQMAVGGVTADVARTGSPPNVPEEADLWSGDLSSEGSTDEVEGGATELEAARMADVASAFSQQHIKSMPTPSSCEAPGEHGLHAPGKRKPIRRAFGAPFYVFDGV